MDGPSQTDAAAGSGSPLPLSPEAEAFVRALRGEGEADFSIGDDLPTIRGYRLERKLETGGQGEVFRGWREGGDHPLVIKVARGHAGSASLALRELNMLKELRLDCLPRLENHGRDSEGNLFLAMEYIDGPPIDEYCDQRFPDRQARDDRRKRVELLAKVARAVFSLNARGFIHRDLKPPHIKIQSDATVKLLDLGVAKPVATDMGATLTGCPVGTPDYMAPEQARGEPATVSSDVYALGAVAYVVLTGHTPRSLDSASADPMRTVRDDPVRPPQSLDPSLSDDLSNILAKATKMSPCDRYSSAMEIANEFERWLKGERVLASPPPRRTVWRRFVEWAAAHPPALTGALCIVIVLAAIPVGWIIAWWQNQQPFATSIVSVDSGPKGSYARLTARSGSTLYEWGNGKAKCVTFAQLTPDRKVAVVGFHGGDQPELCTFDVYRPEGPPLWSSGIGPERTFTVPGLGPSDSPPTFRFQAAALVDIFPENPGPEIIALHLDIWGNSTAIRVYDLNGRVLYEAWHFGWIYSFRWHPGSGLLFLAGVNSEVSWACRGHPEAKTAWPEVVLAVRPVLGQKRGWISSPSRGGDLRPEWYRCVLPPESLTAEPEMMLNENVVGPNGTVVMTSAFVRLDIASDGTAKATVLESSRQQQPVLSRTASAVYLGDLPAVTAPAGPDCQPSKH